MVKGKKNRRSIDDFLRDIIAKAGELRNEITETGACFEEYDKSGRMRRNLFGLVQDINEATDKIGKQDSGLKERLTEGEGLGEARNRHVHEYWRTETVKEWNVITDIIPRVAKNAKAELEKRTKAVVSRSGR